MEYLKTVVGGSGTGIRSSRKEVDPLFFMPDGSLGPDHMINESGVMLLGCGNPLLDISAKVPDSMLTKYEVKPGDIILAEDKHASVYDELTSTYPVEYIAGGATQNSIRVAAWMLVKNKGACAFTGCVGADANATKLKECAEAGGVVVEYQVDAETPTGVCAVLVDSTSDRALITRLDAANNFKKAHLESPAVSKLMASSKIVYSAGFFLTSGGTDCTQFIGEHCAQFSKRFALNISAPFIAQFFTAALDATMPFVDILFANEVEAAALGEVKGWGTDVATVALRVAAMPKQSGLYPRTVVFTQGADSTIVVREGVVTRYPVPKLDKAAIVDTNGAGDSFVGGFLSQLLLDKSQEDCVKAGHFAARVVIQRSGCTLPEKCDYSGAGFF